MRLSDRRALQYLTHRKRYWKRVFRHFDQFYILFRKLEISKSLVFKWEKRLYTIKQGRSITLTILQEV